MSTMKTKIVKKLKFVKMEFVILYTITYEQSSSENNI